MNSIAVSTGWLFTVMLFLSTQPNVDRYSTMIDRHLHWNLY
ncbi:hypothetical protein SAMN05216573_102586 [Bradyrhizobium sp. Rc3b]|nr:hypothetical protein SAMN05216573_102586 [Bradyrhizobium sp. Rc3b]